VYDFELDNPGTDTQLLGYVVGPISVIGQTEPTVYLRVHHEQQQVAQLSLDRAQALALVRFLLEAFVGPAGSERPSFEADLDMVVEALADRFDRLFAKCPKEGADPIESNRWEAAVLMLRCVLNEHLLPMQRHWQNGVFASHKGEKLAGRKG
jgi:hypothetical protein